MQFLLNLVGLLILLPMWGKIALVVGLVAFVVGAGWWLKYQFHKIAEESILGAGAALEDAKVEVHGFRAVPAPTGPSPYDAKPGDDDFMEGVDDDGWDEPGVAFYELDVTVTPTDLESEWSPTGLSVVPADWVPEEKTDICERMGAVHTAHIFSRGRWEPSDDENVTGTTRVKLLIAFQPNGDKAVCLRNFVTPVGQPIALPRPLSGVVGAR